MGAALAPLSLGGQVAGSALSAYGSMAAGNAASNADNYNALLMKQQGTEAIEQGNTKAQLQGQQTQRVLGAQTADYGGGGVVANSGSAVQVFRDTASQGALAQKLSRYQGRIQQLSDTEQGNLDVSQGEAARQAGRISAMGSLITGTDQAAQQAYEMGA